MSRYSISPSCDNAAERRLWGRFPLVSATALFRYEKRSSVQRVVHAMKFGGNTDLCFLMGRQMGLDIIRSARFDDVDTIVPVPLHWLRHFSRGYNQSLLLCQGIAQVLPRPIMSGCIVRSRYTRKQSTLSGDRRAGNVEGVFRMAKPDALQGKHVLLVDDVLTTGATLSSCASVLATVPDVRISVAVFSMA